jgi:hypothetical protein
MGDSLRAAVVAAFRRYDRDHSGFIDAGMKAEYFCVCCATAGVPSAAAAEARGCASCSVVTVVACRGTAWRRLVARCRGVCEPVRHTR